jgi:hypothetical protein
MNDEYPYYNLIYKLNKKDIKELIKEFKPNIITTKFLDAKNIKKNILLLLINGKTIIN